MRPLAALRRAPEPRPSRGAGITGTVSGDATSNSNPRAVIRSAAAPSGPSTITIGSTELPTDEVHVPPVERLNLVLAQFCQRDVRRDLRTQQEPCHHQPVASRRRLGLTGGEKWDVISANEVCPVAPQVTSGNSLLS